ncbi:putative major-facilitator-like ion transporter [Scheffersomyces coipomensis]|uniref:putative major-facilitator-like ion transporter n=1 Tax=Scheffersomyces coipomensis TaxID=1788519 RepID=UPI00315C61CD
MSHPVETITSNAPVELNDKNNEEFIPGTLNIYSFEVDKDEEHLHDRDPNFHRIKTVGNIILIPQPSDSPNDPLNWSPWRKGLCFAIIAFITGFTAATSNDAGAVQDSFNEIYGISYDAMNTGAGVLFIGIGWGTFFLAPSASLYGRKFCYYVCIFLGLLGAVWFAVARRTSDTIWSQLFVGISESCAEAQVQLSLSDLYFQHQLGSVLTVYILATSVGTFLGPLIAGFIVQYAGFRFVGWIAVFISIGLLIVIVFALEETVFDRTTFRGVIQGFAPTAGEANSAPSLTYDDKKQDSKELTNEEISFEDAQKADEKLTLNKAITYGANDPPKSYWKSIQLITPAKNLKGWGIKQYISQLLLLFKVFLYPPVIYSGCVWGIQSALLTFYLTVEDDEWYDPPYNYGNVGVALMNIPTLIGAVIGCFFAGKLSDWFSIWMAKRNNGIQEAEFRLWFLFLPALIAPVGLILFAYGTDNDWSWPPTYVGLGFIGFGFGCSGDVSMSYLMESYPGMVIEMMCGVSVINNMIGCVFTFACSPWLAAMGNTNTFIILAVIQFLIMMGAAPMIYYGKGIRRRTRNWYLEFLQLRDGL